MALATWWRNDPLPELPALPQFTANRTTDKALVAQVAQLTEQEVTTRIQTGSEPYIAYLDQTPVAYGWIASQVGEVVEIMLRFSLPPRQLYLWDFATLPEWRGNSIYPHLLQEIVRQHMDRIERFWILYAPGNAASESGIHKAGFQSVLDFSIENASFSGHPLVDDERAKIGADLLQIPLV
ncbi:GNAT family N-acetyltransferase [Dictyobacter kobayashii]|uniref:N-acetyltransferase domain-containing protein n=1 Tax=Dictyobacter kobayashii TaxID=2014872 RepID=A0A402AQ52_9CHLR|nr:GNAT family N-acetyltransferase [Dictyobacter kobayashii]GCE21174.1 hypothetical protein KDK_49740 [Dictyobacter kobayashii]